MKTGTLIGAIQIAQMGIFYMLQDVKNIYFQNRVPYLRCLNKGLDVSTLWLSYYLGKCKAFGQILNPSFLI